MISGFTRKIIGSLFAVCVVIGLGTLIFRVVQGPKRPKRAVIFVHGTVGSAIIFALDGFHTGASVTDAFLPHRAALQSFRDQPLGRQEQPLMDVGLQILNPALVEAYREGTLDELHGKFGAYQIAGAFDLIAQEQAPDDWAGTRYFTFGWTGALSQFWRRHAGYDLYQYLCDRFGHDTEIILLTHSHGGNVALWLAEAEDQLQRGLEIHTLVLMGCPIQIETAHLATSPVFERVFSFYTPYDGIQHRDYFSTTLRKSYQELVPFLAKNQVNIPGRACIRDVRMIVHGGHAPIDHASMWFIGRSLPHGLNNVIQRCKPIFDVLDPLPISVLLPVMLQQLESSETACAHLDMHIAADTNNGLFTLSLAPHKSVAMFSTTENLAEQVKHVGDLTRESWRSDDPSRHAVLNARFGDGMRSICSLTDSRLIRWIAHFLPHSKQETVITQTEATVSA